jgi:hypothetical protein
MITNYYYHDNQSKKCNTTQKMSTRVINGL